MRVCGEQVADEFGGVGGSRSQRASGPWGLMRKHLREDRLESMHCWVG